MPVGLATQGAVPAARAHHPLGGISRPGALTQAARPGVALAVAALVASGPHAGEGERRQPAMRIDLGDVSLWFDVSGPSAVPRGDTVVERPTLVAVHGGPGSDHVNLKDVLAPLADIFQVLYYDQRGHGRSDRSGAASRCPPKRPGSGGPGRS